MVAGSIIDATMIKEVQAFTHFLVFIIIPFANPQHCAHTVFAVVPEPRLERLATRRGITCRVAERYQSHLGVVVKGW
jgi:hypothetical protein